MKRQRPWPKSVLKDAMEKAAKDASSGQGWGSVSADVRKQIMDAITPKIDWRKVLRYFIKTSQRSNKRSTVRRLNRRFPYIHAGRKVTRQAKIAISIDQSGSVSDDYACVISLQNLIVCLLLLSSQSFLSIPK